MRITTIPARAALYAAAILAAAVPAAAQQTGTLHVAASLDKDEYAQGEPVYLAVRLENRGPREARLPDVLQESNGFLHVQVSGPRGAPRVFVPLAQADSEGTLVIAAGEAATGVVPVFYGTRGWTFPAPGDYTLIAGVTVPGADEPLRSAPVRIRIRADAGGARLMERSRAGYEAARFLLWQSGDHLEAGRALLDSISRTDPRSPVAHYAAFVEGRALSRGFNDFRAGRVRAPEPQRALAYLERADDAVLPRYVRVQKRIAEASSLIQLRREDAARERLIQARALIEADPALAPFAQQVRRLEAAMANAAR